MFIDLLEKLIPTSDKATLVLILDQVELILCPGLLNGPQEVLEDQLSSGLIQDVLHLLVVLHQISLPQLV